MQQKHGYPQGFVRCCYRWCLKPQESVEPAYACSFSPMHEDCMAELMGLGMQSTPMRERAPMCVNGRVKTKGAD